MDVMTADRNASIPSAQLEPELGWTPDVDSDSVPVDSVPVSDSVQESETPDPATAAAATLSQDALVAAASEAHALVGEISDMCGGCADGEHVNPYAVGSIWHTSWGYDQTNVELYTVVRETAASVWLVPMRAEVRDGRLYPTDPVLWTTGKLCEACGGRGYVWNTDDDGFGSRREHCAACGGVAIVNPEMHRKGKHGTYVRLDYVRNAYPYTGGGCYDTYAAGGAGH